MIIVFVSYSSRDRAEARVIWKILKDNGCDVWMDAFDINPSQNLEEELYSHIQRANIFCLLLSPTSVSSKWVKKEIQRALARRQDSGLRIIPIILRPCDIPDDLRQITALRAFEGIENEYVFPICRDWTLNSNT